MILQYGITSGVSKQLKSYNDEKAVLFVSSRANRYERRTPLAGTAD